jgi:dapdiamide synthase
MLHTIRKTTHVILIAYLCSTVVMARAHASNINNNMAKQPKKKVTLIVDPLSSGALIAGELAQYHLSCVAVLSSTMLPKVLLASYNDNASDFIQTFTFDGDIDKLMQDIDAKYIVEAVITGAESGVLLTDQLANRYKVIGNDLITSVARRDKFAMQQQIAASQLHTIPSLVTDRFEEVVTWAQQQSSQYSNGYIVKPIRSSGTDHVKYCRDLNEVKSALNALLYTKDFFGNSNDKVLVQCFITGEEYVVDAVSLDGKHIITGVLKYDKLKTDEGYLLYNTMEFVNKDTFPEKEIVAYAKKALTALGIQNGPSHNEIMYTQYGPVLIESGARMHGGSNPLYCKACSGHSQLEMLPRIYYPHIKAQYYKDIIQYDYQLQQHMSVVFMIAPRTTTTDGMPQFIKAVMALKTYHNHYLDSAQKTVSKTTDLFSCPGFVVLMGSKKTVDADTKKIRSLEKKLYQ